MKFPGEATVVRVMFTQPFFYWLRGMSYVKSIGTNREKDIKPSIHQNQKPQNILRFFVGAEGFEPPTLCL